MLPLEGLKVLDFTQAAAGPFATMIFGDMGADVIKIEPPTGDHFRPNIGGTWSICVNRNKKGFSIDLRKPEAKEIIMRMVKEADVFMEAFVPGVMDRLGFSYKAISEVNPKIIYCSISGYGQTGPYRTRPGYDVCAQAESGIMAATGEPDGGYVRIATSLIDYGTGMFGIIGILLALKVREKTGKGQLIDVSLYDTAVTWMNYWITANSLFGTNPPRAGSGHLYAAPYQVFETKDIPLFIGVSGDRFWKPFCQIANLNHLRDDPKFATNDKRIENKNEIVTLVQEALKKFSSSELKEKLDAAGIPCARVLSISDVVEDPHVKERGMIVEIDDPILGKVKVPAVNPRMSDTPGRIECSTPLIGEHTVEILKKHGYGDGEIQQFLEKKIVVQHGA